MKETLTTGEAASRLYSDKNAAWSYEGARALVEYLEDMEVETGEDIEFDIVCLRCEYHEYDSAISAAAEYGYVTDDEAAALKWLNDRTQVIEFGGGIIIQQF